ncbi:MAG: DNA polymerase I [Sphaerochaetaceae bacterium]|nr:DNA polymerase I [Sphaerochaetaceae bacterium]
MSDKKRVFIVDGYGQIYRSYFAMVQKPLTDSHGNNVSAVFGFFRIILMLVRQYHPDYLIVAMDSRSKTFRHELYPLYKANRDRTPEDLHAQIPVIAGILDAMKISHFERPGMEADDIIATVARNASSMCLETVMVTADKDLLQLVREDVFALRPPKKGQTEYQLCGAGEVEKIFGVRPDQITDYLTMLGDTSDNVPGINGIGEKGAVKILSEYGTLDNAYSHIDEFTPSVRAKLEAAKPSLELSRTLIKLKDDLFGCEDVNLSDFETSRIDWEKAIVAFREIGAFSLVSSAERFLKKTVVTEGTVPVRREKEETKTQDLFQRGSFDAGDGLVGYALKEEIKSLRRDGKSVKPSFDIDVAAWMLGEEQSLTGNAGQDYVTLKQHLEERGMYGLFTDMEMPLLSVLADMENTGIKIDPSRLREYEKELKESISGLESGIFTLCGHPFNVGSPKQLQDVLFTERGLKPAKKTKSGYSTDSDVLEELSYLYDDPVPSLILRYRTLSKLLSTYVTALPSLADEENRIHTTFLQTGTATGRLSSRNPNLQNIPVRTDEGRRIRDAFIPGQGCRLLSADYSQIELAVLAHMSGDGALCRAFSEGLDVHRETASLIFGEFPEIVTDQQRRIAKTINFGVIYGMSAFRLSHDLKISRSDAKRFIDTYFERYSGVREFIDRTIAKASEEGFVKTAMGHVRAVPEVRSSNANVRSAGERVAVNTVIQGTAAEIMKLAMISLSRELAAKKLNTKLLLQVHDEIIAEVPEDELGEVTLLVKACMENACKLDIPLRVSIESGASWGEMK